MKRLKLKNDIIFNCEITVSKERLKKLIVDYFGSWTNYYKEFLSKNFELDDIEAEQLVNNFLKDYSLRKFWNVVKSLKIEVIDEQEITKKRLLDKDYVSQWLSDDKYIGD